MSQKGLEVQKNYHFVKKYLNFFGVVGVCKQTGTMKDK